MQEKNHGTAALLMKECLKKTKKQTAKTYLRKNIRKILHI